MWSWYRLSDYVSMQEKSNIICEYAALKIVLIDGISWPPVTSTFVGIFGLFKFYHCEWM